MTLPKYTTILQVTPALDAGGVEQTTLDVAEAIVAAGGRALVASAGGRLAPELARRGGKLIRMPVDSKAPAEMVRNRHRLLDVIRSTGVDVVHVRSRAPAFSALWAAHRANVPVVATYHGVYNANSVMKRWYNGVMTRGDVVIANSDYTRNHVLEEHKVMPGHVITIPRGVDLSHFDPDAVSPERIAAVRAAWGIEPDEKRLVVLLAGRLTRWKGQLLIIEALRRMGRAGPGAFILILAGDDQGRREYRYAIEGAILELGGDAVRIVGHEEDMPAAYLAADIAVAPSLEPEAFGRTAVEPQAMGRPVIAADHGAARETVVPGETGWLAAPGDPDAWMKALARAWVTTPEQRHAMGLAGRARVERLYSLKAMTDATLSVYNRLIEERGRRA